MTENKKIHALLANIPLFSALQPLEIKHISRGSRVLKVDHGEILFHSGETASGFHIMVYGQIKLAFTSSQGMEKVVRLVEPGECFGDEFMFLDKPYLVSAQAITDSCLIYVEKKVLLDAIEQNPGFAHKMLGGLSEQLYILAQDMEAYSLRSCVQRVIGYLLQSKERKGILYFNFPATKLIIASYLNISPETFSRILRELSAAGLIRVEGKQVAVLDIDRLRVYS
ncbi:MAG: Crp/Fnr family transcriptional regulator [Betaproteobacteria bacterium]|nr:Crp/Fnr family transcriptional regulator [Betaproteobacteria bacterium]